MTHKYHLFAAAALASITLGVWADSLDKEDDACTLDAQGSCVAPNSASLLQKVFQRDRKITIAQEQPQVERPGDFTEKEDHFDLDTVCTGITSQGRCWYLSELGESCDITCEKQGRSLSYVIADPAHPITPRLVDHEPKIKNEPWAALECYVPSEDRYHPANQNAARHYVDKIGTWSHENCKLACPCGGHDAERCNWIAPKECVHEFMWKGVNYTGCAAVDLEHDRPWCQHHYQHLEKDEIDDWSYCTYSCEGEQEETLPKPLPKKKDKCMWTPATSCVKEFDYEGAHYIGCTTTNHETPWCSNTDPYRGSWNHCTYSCEDKPELDDDELCTWEPKPQCAKASKYKGVVYTSCIKQDYPTPWCSLDRVHADRFETCTRVCHGASGTVTPQPKEAKCVWTPASSCVREFDYEGAHYIGCTTINHETPWCSNTDPYRGSWNHCIYSCEDKPELDDELCTWEPKPQCAKASEYKGVVYTGCIKQDNPTPWCSLDRVHADRFETCTRVCHGARGSMSIESVTPQPKEDKCVWARAPSCMKEFDYQGAHYVGCINTNHEIPWCSNTDPYEGSWSYCISTCENKPVAPVPDAPVAPNPAREYPVPMAPVQRTRVPASEPCARRAEVNNDIIGNGVTLDEAGYTITAAAKSPVNMKRFVCRVVAHIGCKVIDNARLEAFTPYYDGVKSTQTFKRLESELSSTCRADGKWIVPRSLQ